MNHKQNDRTACVLNSFQTEGQGKTLGNMTSVKVAPDRTICPGLLFQRFLVVSKMANMSLDDVMRYKLSPFPSALFGAKNMHTKVQEVKRHRGKHRTIHPKLSITSLMEDLCSSAYLGRGVIPTEQLRSPMRSLQ